MSSVKVYVEELGNHVELNWFAGPDEDNRAHVGRLVCRPDEADAIIALLLHDDPLPGLGDDLTIEDRRKGEYKVDGFGYTPQK